MVAVKPDSRVPMALHCPVMDSGAAPGRPMLPVAAARPHSRATVSVPCTEWFTPMVQAMTVRLVPMARAVSMTASAGTPHSAATRSGV